MTEGMLSQLLTGWGWRGEGRWGEWGVGGLGVKLPGVTERCYTPPSVDHVAFTHKLETSGLEKNYFSELIKRLPKPRSHFSLPSEKLELRPARETPAG